MPLIQIPNTILRFSRNPCFRSLLLGLLLLCSARPILTGEHGRISGTIMDSSSAVVLGARMTLTNVDTGVSQ